MPYSDDDFQAMEDPKTEGKIEEICDGHGEMDADVKNYEASKNKLFLVSFVTVFFIIAQSIGGYLSGSIAIFTDTFHLATDMIGFGISIFCLKLCQKQSTTELTYGWHRSEVIGTLASIIFLVFITMFLVKEAIDRVVKSPEIKSTEMLITAVAGLFFNLIQMRILHQGEGHYHMGGDDEHDHDHEDGEDGHDHGHSHSHGGGKDENLNVSAAYCHALSDMIMSVGVIIAATVIYFKPEWRIADPLCTFFFSILVVVTVIPICKRCVHILMEGSPQKVDMKELIKEIKTCDPEMDMHDLHVWSITQSKVALSCHIKTKKQTQLVLKEVRKVCTEKYKIGHVTIQIEDANSTNQFECTHRDHMYLDLDEIVADAK